MQAPAQTPPPKAGRPKHQHSKSGTPGPAGTSAKSHNGRYKNNRNAHKGNNMTTYQNNQLDGVSERASYHQQGYNTDGIAVNGDYAKRPRGSKNHHHASQHSPHRIDPQASVPMSPRDGVQVEKPLPSQASIATPARYAGSGFHASPAPSALPMPKFFSKSVPANLPTTTVPEPSLQSRLDAESPETVESDTSSSDPSSPSVPRAPLAQPPRHQESPLDIFFKADREEKAKKANSLPQSNGNVGAVTPPLEYAGSQGNGQPHHSRHSSQGSGRGIFMMEMDGRASTPRTAPPRPTAPMGRSVTSPSELPQSTKSAEQEQALKSLVFSLAQQSRTFATPRRASERRPSEPSSAAYSPSPFYRPNTTRSTSGPSTPVQRNDNSADASLHYGNRNLSPLFKASKGDSAKRNSSLRTEITANSPIDAQGEFQSTMASTPIKARNVNPEAATVSRNYLNSIIKPPNQQTSAHHGASPFHSPAHNAASGTPPSPFHAQSPNIAPQHSQPININSQPEFAPQPTIPINTTYAGRSSDIESMEQSLKRMLNLSPLPGSITGVR